MGSPGDVTDPDQSVSPRQEAPVREESAPAPATRRADRLRRRVHQVRLYGWTTLLVAALVVIIALTVANTRQVKIGWIFGSSHASLVWIILAAAIVGWLAGLAPTGVVVRRRIRRAIEP
ncbi:MAG TPA: hypothetical protein VFA44_07180 [Gaiellaceae bacterium]|nr:hypothetical protein [Gaiellaceae bacterium]